ncbi:hypothetical protein CLV80_10214 [Yoonia maritima]|uniref:Lipoprotein n=1 Tax=Yoonia maritima TaxID=1435347 RepID=A0A2T0W2C4_9RHOB|nr:hypothetical protein [Yoonia maritima]PRY79371.1 hypothetical protein CLV80_10214 [Yoonia maritima]
MRKAINNLSVAMTASLLVACSNPTASTSEQATGGAGPMRSSLVNATIESSFSQAIAACANYVVSGTSLSSLGSYGFQPSGSKYIIALENPDVLGNSKVVAAPRRDECRVTASPTNFRDNNTVASWVEPALIRADFEKRLRPLNEYVAETYFVKNGVAVDLRRSSGGGGTNVILKRQ